MGYKLDATPDENQPYEQKNCAYLKFINIPNILDIGGTTPDPTDESLTMSMIDYATLCTLSEFAPGTDIYHTDNDFNQGGSLEDSPVELLKKAFNAVHINKRVVQAKVTFTDQKQD